MGGDIRQIRRQRGVELLGAGVEVQDALRALVVLQAEIAAQLGFKSANAAEEHLQALARKGVVEQAVVFDPNRNELFTASKGAGAFLNDRRIRVSKRLRLSDALIGTGFPYRQFSNVDTYLAIFKELTQKTAGLRRPGAASLDLAYVAAGRLDGFWEFGLSPWDMAAGSLLISEAGGLVSDLSGESDYLTTGNIVAGTPKVFPPLMQIVQGHCGDKLQIGRAHV